MLPHLAEETAQLVRLLHPHLADLVQQLVVDGGAPDTVSTGAVREALVGTFGERFPVAVAGVVAEALATRTLPNAAALTAAAAGVTAAELDRLPELAQTPVRFFAAGNGLVLERTVRFLAAAATAVPL